LFTAIRDDGYREILSATVADSEDEPCWESCFNDLKALGLESVKLVISDGHKGIQAAIEKAFLGASWQTSLTEVSESFDEVETWCNVHFMRAVLKT
jgi:transposase-like protein